MCVDAEDKLAELRSSTRRPAGIQDRRGPAYHRVGKWLRKLSLDETAQLSMSRSDMSIVGPRPHCRLRGATYDDYQRQRLLVKRA